MDECSPEAPPPLSPKEAALIAARHLSTFRTLGVAALRRSRDVRENSREIILQYPRVDSRVYAFIDDCVREKVIFPFHWARFAGRATELVERSDGIESASLDELRRLLTVIVRQDRFASGVIAEMAERGVFLRIVERMANLEMPAS